MIISIKNLRKNYESVEAIKGIDLDIEKGQMFGLVGPDGAGKTTTIRVLCGLINQFSGSVEMFGEDILKNKKEIQHRIGYLSQRFSLYGDLSIDENIEFFANIHDVKNFEARRTELLDFTRLVKFRDRLANNLSGGMKQKLALASSLIHKPQILFLDEPTTGVDPVSRRDFWKILSTLLKEGITIFMTTPYLDEAERCDKIALMNEGEIIAVDTPQNIKDSIGRKVVEVVCDPSREAFKIIKEYEEAEVQLFGDRLHIIVDSNDEHTERFEEKLKAEGIKTFGTRTNIPSLENVFIHLIKKAG
ncbi:MAG: ABC transporter ATP-binding protein [Melioribacteraceae bacterium]|nr:ABC transporter ATP-binding protein [Melioribacteraceae bacterium]MCF8262928.1 ABC transporter ATP-binding protein [Melioribacteraceae bacterium]MCF8431093.1 ABC transporter ATP-binding protein [Melioribacteraceae bacterium]